MLFGKRLAAHGINRRQPLFPHFFHGIVDFLPIRWGLYLGFSHLIDNSFGRLTLCFSSFAHGAVFGFHVWLMGRRVRKRRSRGFRGDGCRRAVETPLTLS